MIELQKQLKSWRNRPQELRYRGSNSKTASTAQTNQVKTRSSRAASSIIDHSHQSNKSYQRPTSSSGSRNPISIQYQNQQMKLKIKSLEQQIHRTNRSLSKQSRSNLSQPIDVTARQLSDQNDEMRGKIRKTILLVKKFFLSFRRLQRALHKRQEDDISKFKVQFEACRHELRDYVQLIERGIDQGDERGRNIKVHSGNSSFPQRQNISSISLSNSINPPKIRAYKGGDQQYTSHEHSTQSPTYKSTQNLMANSLLSQQAEQQNMPSQSTPRLQSNNVAIQNELLGISPAVNKDQYLGGKLHQQNDHSDMAQQLRRQLQSVQIEHRQAQDQIRILKGQNNDLIKQLSKNAAQIQQQVLDLQCKQNEQKQINDMKIVENQELQDQMEVLAKSNEEFKQQILQISQREQHNIESIKQLQQQVDEAKSSEKSSIVEIKQNLIEMLDKTEQPLFQRIQNLESEVSQKEKDLNQLQAKIRKLGSQSISKIKKLEKDLVDTSSKQSQGKIQMKQLVEQLGSLHKKRNQELKSNDSEKKKVCEALDKSTNLVKSLQTENQKLKSNATKQQGEKIKTLTKQISEKAAKIKSLNTENQKLISQNSKEKSEKAKINSNFEKTIDDLKKQITNIKKQSQKKNQEIKKKQESVSKKHEMQIKKAKDQIKVAQEKIKQHVNQKTNSMESSKIQQKQHQETIEKLKVVIKQLEERQTNQKQKSKKLQEEKGLMCQQALNLKSHKEKLEKDHKNAIQKSQLLIKQIADMEDISKQSESDKQYKINEIIKQLCEKEQIILKNQNQKKEQAENAKKQLEELIEKTNIENNIKINELIQTLSKQHEKDLQVAQSNSIAKYQEILNQQTSKLKAELDTQLLEAEKSLKESQNEDAKKQIQQLSQEHSQNLRMKQDQLNQKITELTNQLRKLRGQIDRINQANKQENDNLNKEIQKLADQNSALSIELQKSQKIQNDNTIASLNEKQKLHTLLNKTKASHQKELQEQQDLQAAFKKQHNEMAKVHKDRIKELQSMLHERDEQLIDLEKKLMNEKNADKQALEANHKKEFDQQRSKNQEQRKKWEEEKQELIRDKLQSIKELQNKYRDENDKLFKQHSDSKDQQQQKMVQELKKRDEQIDQLSNEMVDLKLKRSSLQSQIDEDQIKLDEKDKDIEKYIMKLEKVQTQCKELQNQKIKIQEENLDTVNELKKQISERDNLIQTANTQLQEYNMQKMFIKTSLKDLIKDCSIIANESGSYAEESFNADLDFEAIIKALRQQIDDLRLRVDEQSKMNISKLTENSARFQQQDLKKDNELNGIKQKNDSVQKQNTQLRQELGQAKRLNDEVKQMLAKAQDNFQNLRKQTETSESKLQKYKDRVNILETQAVQERKKAQQVKNMLEKQIQELSNHLQGKGQSLKELWLKLEKLTNQNEDVNKKNTDIIQRNKRLKNEKESTQKQLNDLANKKKDFHDIIKDKSDKQLQILRRAKYQSKSWILVEQSPQNYSWIPQFQLNADQQARFSKSILEQNLNSQVLEDLNQNYQSNIKNLMQERNQLNQHAVRGSDPGGFIGSLSIGGEMMDKQSIKDKIRANKAETEILKLQKKIGELLILIYELPDDDAAKRNVKKIAELTRQNEQLGERYEKLQRELTNIELTVEKNASTPRIGGVNDNEESKTPKADTKLSESKPPRKPASVRGDALGTLSPTTSQMHQRPGTELAPGEQFLFENQSAMSIRSGSQAFQDFQTLMKKLQDSEKQIKESQNTQDLLLNQNRQLKKVILALEKKLKKITNKQGEAAVQHGRSVLAKFLKGCPYASKQLEQILIVAMNVLQFSQKQIALIQQQRVKTFGQPPKDEKKKKASAFVRMFQKKKK